MAEPQKVWNKHKITAIVIMLIAVAVVFSIYMELESPAINHPKSLERSIANCIDGVDLQVKVIQIEEHDKYLIATFTDERYPNFMGIARFHRGSDHFWHPIRVQYENEFAAMAGYGNENKNEAIIYGINTDSRIAHIKGMNQDQEVLYEQNITDPNFIKYDEFKGWIHKWGFFDVAGNDITVELKAEQDDSGPTGVIDFSEFGLAFWGIYLAILLFASIPAAFFWIGNSNPIRYSKTKEKRKETTPVGHMNKLKNLDKEKKTALYILMITLVVAVSFHSVVYSTFNSESGLTKSIEKYTGDSEVTIVKTATEGKYLVALYTTEKPYYKGIVAFERGWNGLWVPFECSRGADICISAYGINLGGEYYVIVTGVECDPRAVSYEYLHEYREYIYLNKEPITVYSSDIFEPNFIHIYNASNRRVFIPKIYDSAGNNIAPELTKEFQKEIIYRGGGSMRSVSTLYLIKTTTIMIVAIGFLTAWSFWIKTPKKKDE